MQPDEEIEEVIDAFDNDLDKAELDSNFSDAFPWVVGIVSGLVTFLSILILILWIWSEANGGLIGGPAPTLTGWEESYRDLTGLDEIEGLDGTGVVVCVVDSGIELNHPDLQHIELSGWFDAINSHETPYDDEGHGTAMAGLLVAQNGLRGASPGVELLIAKAIDESGSGTDSGIAQAVNWCVENQADIISLSLGGEGGIGFAGITTDELEQAVQDALDDGVFVIAAAGNDGQDDDGDVSSPGSVEDVICVGGVTRLGNVWSGSSKGDNNGQLWPPILPRSDPDKKPELIAPAAEVPVLMAGGSGDGSWWGWASGTSASTAWVSGGLALLLEAHPELQREGASGGQNAIEMVKQRLSENSQMDNNQNEHDDYFGYGIFRIDLLINSMGNESETVFEDGTSEENTIVLPVLDSYQAERRKTASVPPVSSTKAAE